MAAKTMLERLQLSPLFLRSSIGSRSRSSHSTEPEPCQGGYGNVRGQSMAAAGRPLSLHSILFDVVLSPADPVTEGPQMTPLRRPCHSAFEGLVSFVKFNCKT